LQTRKVAEIIEVEEVLDIIEQGFTMPVKCRLKNGMNAIVKYMKNPGGQQVLLNEWVGSNIADIIGLTIPEYGICNLTENVIDNTNYNEEIDIRNSGPAFYTKYYSKAIPAISMGMLSSVSNKETEKIILFDHLVNNNDRHNGNLLCDISKGATLYVIDNSHIITLEPNVPFVYEDAIKNSEILSGRIIKTNGNVYDLLSQTIGYSENRVRECAEEIKKMLSRQVIEEIKAGIPACWVDSVGREKAEQLFEILNKRISLLDEIAEMIIRERRMS